MWNAAPPNPNQNVHGRACPGRVRSGARRACGGVSRQARDELRQAALVLGSPSRDRACRPRMRRPGVFAWSSITAHRPRTGTNGAGQAPAANRLSTLAPRLRVWVVPRGKCIGKVGVQRRGRVIVVQDKQIVNVTPDDETLAGLFPAEGKNTWIGGALCEAVCEKPRKKRPLPTSTSLGHAVNGLFLSANAGTAVCA
eukprot:3435495-Pleurochrysis_carterae.AAC.2